MSSMTHYLCLTDQPTRLTQISTRSGFNVEIRITRNQNSELNFETTQGALYSESADLECCHHCLVTLNIESCQTNCSFWSPNKAGVFPAAKTDEMLCDRKWLLSSHVTLSSVDMKLQYRGKNDSEKAYYN